MMGYWSYRIFINDELVDETCLLGIAYMKFETAKLLGCAEIQKVYVGKNFDPVLHQTTIEVGGIIPPCPSDVENCSYKKSYENGFYTTPRPTAVRTEIMCPQDRCGFMLKPSRIGGEFFDYGLCRKFR